jgi:ribosomal protein L37E
MTEDGRKLAITCPRCGKTSHHPTDVAEGYCGNCHAYTSPPRPDPTVEDQQ